jgi:hypothetical protein
LRWLFYICELALSSVAERLDMTETQFKKGKEKGPGRPKGMPNKNTAKLKEMILEALDKAGGVEYLLSCANNEKTQGAFLSLIGKVLPMTITGAGADGEHVFTVIERRIVKASD